MKHLLALALFASLPALAACESKTSRAASAPSACERVVVDLAECASDDTFRPWLRDHMAKGVMFDRWKTEPAEVCAAWPELEALVAAHDDIADTSTCDGLQMAIIAAGGLPIYGGH